MLANPGIAIKRAILARPKDGSGNPGPTFQLLLFPESGSAPIPPDLRIEFTFANGLGAEVWYERLEPARETIVGCLIIPLRPARPDQTTLAEALVREGAQVEEVAHLSLSRRTSPQDTLLTLKRVPGTVKFEQTATPPEGGQETV